ncbi:lipid-A-disaccharide synthase [Thermodesulfobacterium sp. TA1]|uniref:lipid-A-disaccharide synthase n=1 Tax=Thermodesulfobacterium sp. TA1 TaxID=2234087 RepID=UPI001232AC1E|nr:lipid-A-disaccharide synthase [Thermodesulfobacterium sp. TA1]QER41549.1 lipid-A-disaccharide synthase [Thermodesulfobacterium sp. TA1]
MTSEASCRIFILTGELSGDLYGSLLIKRIKEINAAFQFVGVGGPKMRSLGIDILFSAEPLALVGLPNLSELKKYWFVYKKIKEFLAKKLVDVVVLVDFPGFNLKIAKLAKEMGYPVIYYVAPQVWAWHKSRIKVLKRYVDRLYVVLPFEKEFFSSQGIPTVFLGHPILDLIKVNLSKEMLFEIYGLDLEKPILSFFPGSREKEIQRHVPLFLKVYQIVKERVPEVQGIMVKALGLKDSFIWEGARKELKVIENTQYEVLKHSTAALLASGTITLEAAVIGTPAVVTYSLPSWMLTLAKRLVKVPFISLPNLILGKEVYQEIVGIKEQEKVIAQSLIELLKDQDKQKKIKEDLSVLKKEIGPPGASWRIAEDMARYLISLKRRVS